MGSCPRFRESDPIRFRSSRSLADPIHRIEYPDCTPLDGGGFALSSPAKINLGLRVVGKRPDGFHELDTIFQEVDLCDRIEFRPGDNWTLQVRGADLATDDTNLVTRAAHLLSEHAGAPLHARVVLEKRIPIGGGLGGGSSNGSITLHGLNRLWELGLTPRELWDLARRLGSDCPFFVYGGLARGRGRGEWLELYEGADERWVVLATPDFGVSTKRAFESGRFPLTEPDKKAIFKACSGRIEGRCTLPGMGVNSLENLVLDIYPQLAGIRACMERTGADVSLLSGTGSTVFGLFGSRVQAEHAAHQLALHAAVHIGRAVSRKRSTPSLAEGSGA